MNSGSSEKVVENKNDSATEPAPAPIEARSRVKWFMVAIVFVSVAICVTLATRLMQAGAREAVLVSKVEIGARSLEIALTDNEQLAASNRDLTAKLRASEEVAREIGADRDRLRVSLRSTEAARDEALSALRHTRIDRDNAQAARRSAQSERDELAASLEAMSENRDRARSDFAECSEALDTALAVARRHRDTLDEISSAIRIGMIGVTSIPSKGFTFGSGFDLESEYRKVVDEYNDLVRRFNAAVERSNDLGEIVNKIISILRN
jgi:hypothetical protein